jgi:hypothetical protein
MYWHFILENKVCEELTNSYHQRCERKAIKLFYLISVVKEKLLSALIFLWAFYYHFILNGVSKFITLRQITRKLVGGVRVCV